MGLEAPTGGKFYIHELVVTNPTSTDFRREGDDHIRLIKKALKDTFPNVQAEVRTSANELNSLKNMGGKNVAEELDKKADVTELEKYGPLDQVNIWTKAQRAQIPGATSIPQDTGNIANLGNMSQANFFIFDVDDNISGWTWDEDTLVRGAVYQLFLDVTDTSPVEVTWPSTFVWSYGEAPAQLEGSSQNLLTLIVRTTGRIYASLTEQWS